MRALLTGDSIIARHEGMQEPILNYELKRRDPDLLLTNTAVSGINSGAFFARLSELILKQKQHDVLVILLGTNDLATHKQVPIRQFKNNMELIVSAVVCEYWPQYVVLISPPAVDEKKQQVRNNQLVKQYSTAISEVAEEYGTHYLDLAQAMIEHGDLSHLCHGIKNDGLHFGAAGYQLLADLLFAQLKKIKK